MTEAKQTEEFPYRVSKWTTEEYVLSVRDGAKGNRIIARFSDEGDAMRFADYANALADRDRTIADQRKVIDALDGDKAAANCRITDLEGWINDLQSGMYVNCVYCGHRFGPDPGTPVAMADILKQHIEKCQKHPLSEAKQQIATLQDEIRQWKAGAEGYSERILELTKQLAALTAERDKLRDFVKRVSEIPPTFGDRDTECSLCRDELQRDARELLAAQPPAEQPIYTIVAPKDSLEVKYELPQPPAEEKETH